MKEEENLLVEAVRCMLRQDAKLGLAYHKPSIEKRESSHFMQFQRETIDDMYQLSISESKFADSLTAAFMKVHCHKFIDDPTFKVSMGVEMRSMGLPKEEMDRGLKAIDKVIKELTEDAEFSERDAGWNDMGGLKDVTTNADRRKVTREPPWTGGGPAPQPNRNEALKG